MFLRIVPVLALAVVVGGCSPAEAPREAAQPATTEPMADSPAATPAGQQELNTDEDIVRVASSAAPADVSGSATIVDPGEDGTMREVRAGTNGWVCMARPQVMCLDKQWQDWSEAWMNKREPKVSGVGIAYMLRGDTGASNIDPYATEATPDNQWVTTGPHIMLLTPDAAQLEALPTDPHAGGPWVMWKGTPYAHIMVPMEEMGDR